VVEATGAGFAPVNSGGSISYAMPSWYPDGSAILAAAGGGAGFTQIEKLDVGTGAPTNITNTLGSEATAIINRLVISPDGTKAVFDARVGSVSRIFVIDLAAKTVTKANEYTNDPGANDTFPGWMSKDLVSFGSDSGGADNVYSVKPDGTARSLLLPNAIEAWFGPQQ
jgi:TolB protein